MSAFKPGDVCEVIRPLVHPDSLGRVVEIIGSRGQHEWNGLSGETFWIKPVFNSGWVFGFQLRKIDPPNKDEPITDFTPADDDFVQDLMKRVKQRESSTN